MATCRCQCYITQDENRSCFSYPKWVRGITIIIVFGCVVQLHSEPVSYESLQTLHELIPRSLDYIQSQFIRNDLRMSHHLCTKVKQDSVHMVYN